MPYVYVVDPLDLPIRDSFDYGRLIRRIQDRQLHIERVLNSRKLELPIIQRQTRIDGTTERVRVVSSWLDLATYPTFTKRLNDTTLISGRNLQLEAQVTGFPKPDVQWYKDSVPIVETANIKMNHYYPDSYVLSIYNVRPTDRGLYTCRAANPAGSSTTMAIVRVEPNKCPYVPLRSRFYDVLYTL